MFRNCVILLSFQKIGQMLKTPTWDYEKLNTVKYLFYLINCKVLNPKYLVHMSLTSAFVVMLKAIFQHVNNTSNYRNQFLRIACKDEDSFNYILFVNASHLGARLKWKKMQNTASVSKKLQLNCYFCYHFKELCRQNFSQGKDFMMPVFSHIQRKRAFWHMRTIKGYINPTFHWSGSKVIKLFHAQLSWARNFKCS